MPVARAFQDPGLTAAPTVPEGGTIVITVAEGITHVFVKLPGQPSVKVPVVDGRAEFQLPPTVPGGSIIHISDMRLPSPSSARVQVVGGQGS